VTRPGPSYSRPVETPIQRARLANRLSGLSPSLYARILAKLATYPDETYPFHIGETHLLPHADVLGALPEIARDPGIHHYAHPQGILELREQLAHDLQGRGLPDVAAGDIVVTHGATHGLNLACQAILDPGDVMLVLSPHWPLINAMVHTASAVPVEVPFTCQLRRAGASPYELLSRHKHPRTRAIYLTSPNNPDGVVLSREELGEVARFCIEHDLYALVDEAYERFVFEQQRPVKLAAIEGMADRTISVFTFSKSHRLAGVRVGFSVAPHDVLAAMIKLANISIYNVSLLTQRAALAALGAGGIEETVDAARRAAERFCARLQDIDGADFLPPAGGAYVFAHLDELLGDRSCFDLLDTCLDAGVVFAPGQGFGQAYSRWARFCFTAMDPARLDRGTERLADLLTTFSR
jgi:aspartate/methionine/tyrosine aminotransferase